MGDFEGILNSLARMDNVDVYVTGSNAKFLSKDRFLKKLFEETYISDIIGRNRVKNKAELEEILNILASAMGSLTNPSKLSATFKSIKNKVISQNTIKKYIEYLEDSYLIDGALRYDIKVFNELKVRGYNVDVGVIIANEVNKKEKHIRKQLEIDFVCKDTRACRQK